MTEHLTSEELERYQFDGRVRDIASLARDCRDRFVRAANLVGMRSPAIESLLRFGYFDGIDVAPLLGAWVVICDRYVAERYKPQLALLPDLIEDEPVRWSRFVYHHLFPQLVRDDELVRNVLRALGALPCTSPSDAATAVRIHFRNMSLPSDPPPWAPEEDIDL